MAAFPWSRAWRAQGGKGAAGGRRKGGRGRAGGGGGEVFGEIVGERRVGSCCCCCCCCLFSSAVAAPWLSASRGRSPSSLRGRVIFFGRSAEEKGDEFSKRPFLFCVCGSRGVFFFLKREREREKKSTSLFPSSLSPTRVLLRFVFSLFFSPPFFSLVSLFLPPPRGSQCSAAPSRRDTSPSSMPWGRSRCSCGRRMVRGGV